MPSVALPSKGCTYVQQANSAGFVKGDAVIECPAEGNMFMLPASNAKPARAAEMEIVAAKFKKFVQQRIRNQLLEHNRTHNPTDAEECDSCKQASNTKEPSRRKELNQYRNAEFDGLVLTVDFITGMPRDNDGNTNAFNVDEATHDLGYITPTASRSGADTLQNFKVAVQKIIAIVPKDKRFIKT